MRRQVFPIERSARLVDGGFATRSGDQIEYTAQGYRDSFLDGEEQVRADLYFDLVTDLGYAAGDIEFEKLHKIGHPHKKSDAKVDIVVRYPDDRPFMVMELKSPEEYEGYLESSIKTQLFNVAAVENQGHNSIQYLVYHTRDWVNDQLLEKTICIDYSRWRSFEEWDAGGRVNLRSIPKDYGRVTVPKYVRGGSPDLNVSATREEMQRIRRDLHNILWGGGKYQNELFFNLVGLFLAKIYDEKETVQGAAYGFQIYFKDDEPEAAADVYRRMNEMYYRALKEYLKYTDEELAKVKDIVFDANKVRYVVEVLQGISFTTSRFDIIGDFFEGIVRGEFKQSKGQYLTHTNLIAFIVEALGIGDLALHLVNSEKRLPWMIDPSCGSGAFLIAAMQATTEKILASESQIRQSHSVREFVITNFPELRRNAWAREYIHGIEINTDLAAATKVNMVGHGDGSANIEAKDGLGPLTSFEGGRLQVSKSRELYSKAVNEQFDVVLSNPPFSVTVDRDTASALPAHYERGQEVLAGMKDSKELEVATELLFIERYYQLLRPGGRLGVVLPESVFDAASTRDVRVFLFRHFHVRGVVSLPNEAFAPYTTTKTSILLAQKKTDAAVKEWQDAWGKAQAEYLTRRTKVDAYVSTPAVEKQLTDLLAKVASRHDLELQKRDVRAAVKARLDAIQRGQDERAVRLAAQGVFDDLVPEASPEVTTDFVNSLGRARSLKPNIDAFLHWLDTPEVFVTALRDLLSEHFDEGDVDLETRALLAQYEEAVRAADEDWWCFREVAGVLGEPIFMAHAQHIGYKRGVRGEDDKPNELLELGTARDAPPFLLEQFLATDPWK